MSLELIIDPERTDLGPTGIWVRALDAHMGEYTNADIAHLTRDSLLQWLRSRDDRGMDVGATWRDNVILLLFGHGVEI